MYKVWMTNFNQLIYTGTDPNEAVAKAVDCGFECHLLHQGGIMSYSPITGWRTVTSEGEPVGIGAGAENAKRIAAVFMPPRA